MKELSIQSIQKESLKILKIIDRIAQKENLKYSLFYGTLIGAVRHKGFIPWDDDLDIIMFRADYDKLKEYFITHKDELNHYEFFCPETKKDYPYLLGRVVNTDFKMLSDDGKDLDMGTFVDVYVFDGAGDGTHNLVYQKACFYTTLYGLKNKNQFIKPHSGLKAFFKRILYYVAKLFSYENLRKKLYAIASRYDFESSEYLSCLVWTDGGKVQIFKKNDLEDVVSVEFEDGHFMIPKKYDNILTQLYGDYMQLPPENQRIGHHYYKIYPKNEED